MTLTLERKIGKDAWLQGFGDSTQKVYSLAFATFLEFMSATEEGSWDDLRLIEERKEDLESRVFAFEQKIVEFYEWMKDYVTPERTITVTRRHHISNKEHSYEAHISGGKKLSDNARKTYVTAARSFFSHHRLDLRFTKQQKRKLGKKARPKRSFYEFTLDDVREMSAVAKPKERYILLAGKDLGLRASDFSILKQGTFTAHLSEEPPISLGEIYTIKEGVLATPFIGPDGKHAAEQWLKILKAKGDYGPDKPMLTIAEKELTENLKRLVKKAHIKTGNQEVRFHQLRVFWITRASKVLETNRWKQIVGKQVPESAYVKPFKIREDYKKVLPLTTIRRTHATIEKEELDDLKKEMELLRKRDERRMKLIETRDLEIESVKSSISLLQKEMEEIRVEIKKLSGSG